MGAILDNAIYGLMAVTALYGVYTVILLLRRIRQKRFSGPAAAEAFLGDARDELARRNFDGVADLCDSPPYWSKAVPQLILLALQNRDRDPKKIRRLLAENFEREVLAEFEYRMSWIATVVKTEPMFGLLGTVIGMINAFAKIAGASAKGIDPTQLAGDISFALFTTAIGLFIAIPLTMAAAAINVRIGKLQDAVQQHLGIFLEDFEAALESGGRPEPASVGAGGRSRA